MLKDNIKVVIREFHESKIPELTARRLSVDFSVLRFPVNKIITIIGPRRAGKTFYMFQIIKRLLSEGNDLTDILYINFEDERILPLGAENLQTILDAYFEMYGDSRHPFIFLDEIQNIDAWETFVRRLNNQGYAVFVTGSNSRLLSREIATALRGRTLSYEMFPFSFSEYLTAHQIEPSRNSLYGKQRHIINKLYQTYLFSGGYPEITFIDNEPVRRRIFQDYFNTVFYRDLVECYRINNTELLRKWMNALMVNISSLVSFRKYENDFKSQGMKLSNATLSNFARYLEDVFFGFFIEIHSESVRKRQINPKKFYLVDLGLHNYLTLKFSENKGRLLENLVFLELKRRDCPVSYYKTNSGHEVDFLISDKITPQLVQVCHDPADLKTFNREIRALRAAMRELSLNSGLVLTHDTKNQIKFGKQTIDVLPVREWLLYSEIKTQAT